MFFSVYLDYVRWHYSEALFHYVRLLKTAWWFVTAFFSMSQLWKTLFKPYRRMGESDGSTWEAVITTLVINCLSRIVGFCIRITLLGIGFISLSLLTVAGIFGYFFWLVLPFLPATCVFIGTLLLLNALFV